MEVDVDWLTQSGWVASKLQDFSGSWEPGLISPPQKYFERIESQKSQTGEVVILLTVSVEPITKYRFFLKDAEMLRSFFSKQLSKY